MKCLSLQWIQQSFTQTNGNIGKTQIPIAFFLKLLLRMNSAEYSHTASCARWFKLTTVSELNTIPMIIVLMWLIIQPGHNTHLHKNIACGCMQFSGVIRSSMKIATNVDRKKQQLCQLYGGGGNWDTFTPQQLQDK